MTDDAVLKRWQGGEGDRNRDARYGHEVAELAVLRVRMVILVICEDVEVLTDTDGQHQEGKQGQNG